MCALSVSFNCSVASPATDNTGDKLGKGYNPAIPVVHYDIADPFNPPAALH